MLESTTIGHGSLADLFSILLCLKTQLNVPFFMEILASLSWAIWTIRNDNIFSWKIILSSKMQSYLQGKFFSSYPRSKREIQTLTSFMVEQHHDRSRMNRSRYVFL
jgi:hypothetical protein